VIEPATISLTIAIIFLTKALEKAGEKFGETTISKLGAALDKIREHSHDLAQALEDGDEQVLKLSPTDLAQIPTDPVYIEFLDTANVEQNEAFRAGLPEVKAGKILQIMASGIKGTKLKAGSIRQTAPADSMNVEQRMLENVEISGDIDLGDLSQG
jgi:hypothetical protein